MKLHTMILGAALLTTSLTPVGAREAVIGLSPNQAPVTLKTQVERIVEHLLDTVDPGETVRFFDATKVRIITTFAVPDNRAYANPRAKLQANRKALQALKRFIDSARAVPGRIGQIDLPGLMRSVRQNYPTKEADLIVLGSPVYDDVKAPSLSMRDGRVPNDGHVASSAGRSPFGTTRLPGSLDGYTVYFGLIGADASVSTQHAYHLERFWSLAVQGHGGSLLYYGDDLETLLGRAGKQIPKRVHADPLVATDKLEMLHFAADSAEVPDLYTQPLEAAPAPKLIWRNARGVRVGITWDCLACDLDLHLRPNRAAPVIYFNQAKTPEGQLFKDFLNSPTTGFETVALNGSVDLSQMRLAVNFYGGRAPRSRVTGELRIAIGEKVWATPFTLKASNGNKGAGAESAIRKGVAPNTAWIIVDPIKVIGAK